MEKRLKFGWYGVCIREVRPSPSRFAARPKYRKLGLALLGRVCWITW
jgi:hypothetical protein